MFKWLAQGHITSKSWSWDLTPGDLSNFGKGHFGRAELGWHLHGELGHTEGNVGGSGRWEKGLQKKKVPNSTVKPKIWCQLQGTSPSTKGHQMSEWTRRTARSSCSTDYSNGQRRKTSFFSFALESSVILQPDSEDRFLLSSFHLSLPLLSHPPSLPRSFSFQSKCMLRYHNALNTVLGTEQNRQGLVHMGIIIQWGDRQKINKKPWKITTTTQITRKRECASGQHTRGVWPGPRVSGKLPGKATAEQRLGGWQGLNIQGFGRMCQAERPVREGGPWGRAWRPWLEAGRAGCAHGGQGSRPSRPGSGQIRPAAYSPEWSFIGA